MNLMQLIPEWAPNIHPMLVHFPIGLLVAAVLMDLLQWFRPLRTRLDLTAVILYTLGSLGSIAAFWSGRIASETVQVSIRAQTVMSDHDDWALYTMVFFLVFTAIRIALYLLQKDRLFASRMVLPLVALIGVGLLWQTGELGKELVYKHGVGVAAVEVEEPDLDYTVESRFERQDDGWLWVAGSDADESFQDHFQLQGEQAEQVSFHTGEDDDGYYIEIHSDNVDSPVFLTVPEPVGDISLEASLNKDHFDGRVGLVHHFHGTGHFEFMDFDGDIIRLGRHEHGSDAILDDDNLHAHGWTSLRVVADGRHFHAYSDDDMIVHGHASAWEPGHAGLFAEGDGVIRLRMLHLVLLREGEEEHEEGAHQP